MQRRDVNAAVDDFKKTFGWDMPRRDYNATVDEKPAYDIKKFSITYAKN